MPASISRLLTTTATTTHKPPHLHLHPTAHTPPLTAHTPLLAAHTPPRATQPHQITELEKRLTSSIEEKKTALRQIEQELTMDSQRRIKQAEVKLKESEKEVEHWKAEFQRVTESAVAANEMARVAIKVRSATKMGRRGCLNVIVALLFLALLRF